MDGTHRGRTEASILADSPPEIERVGSDSGVASPSVSVRDDEGDKSATSGGGGDAPITTRTPDDVAGAIRTQRTDGKPPPRPRAIAFMNQKGGVGKTTTCANLGAALARAGHRVLLVDLDPQAHLSLHLGVDPASVEHSIYDLLTDDELSALDVLHQPADNLWLLPSEVSLAGVEAELADRVVTGAAQTVLRTKVAPLLNPTADSRLPNPDYILIDCPPSLGLLTINALVLANEVIVPMQPHFLALQGLSKLFETVAMVRGGINRDLMICGVVLCMHEKQTILAGEVISDIRTFLDEARGTDAPWRDAVVYDPPIRRNIKLAESPSFGQSIFDYAPDCHGAADYAKLAQSVAAQVVSGQ